MTPPTPDATSPENLARIEALARPFANEDWRITPCGLRFHDTGDPIYDLPERREVIAACKPKTVLALVAEIRRLRAMADSVENASLCSELATLHARVAELEKALWDLRGNCDGDFDYNWSRGALDELLKRVDAALSGAKGKNSAE